jgi:hypothetical protein
MTEKKPAVLLMRWWAPKTFGLALARQVMGYRRRYEKQNERVTVLYALDACLNNGYLPEPWMLKGLWDAVTALEDGADPNEAFGYVRPKGKHLKVKRTKRRQTLAILFRIYDLHCNERQPLDESGAFRIAGDEFGHSASVIRRIHNASPLALRDWLKWATRRQGIRKAMPEDLRPFEG